MRGMSNSNRLSARNPSLDDFFLRGQPSNHAYLAVGGPGTEKCNAGRAIHSGRQTARRMLPQCDPVRIEQLHMSARWWLLDC
jgi:hypothetical protein